MLMKPDGGTGDWAVSNWPEADFKTHIQFTKLPPGADRTNVSPTLLA